MLKKKINPAENDNDMCDYDLTIQNPNRPSSLNQTVSTFIQYAENRKIGIHGPSSEREGATFFPLVITPLGSRGPKFNDFIEKIAPEAQASNPMDFPTIAAFKTYFSEKLIKWLSLRNLIVFKAAQRQSSQCSMQKNWDEHKNEYYESEYNDGNYYPDSYNTGHNRGYYTDSYNTGHNSGYYNDRYNTGHNRGYYY